MNVLRQRPKSAPIVTDPDILKDEVIQLHLSVKSLIQDIYDCKGGVLTLNELNKTGRERLVKLQKKIQEIENLSDEVDEESVRLTLKQCAETQSKQLLHTQSLLRKANLACKQAIDNREKDQLLGSRESRLEQIKYRRTQANKEQMSKTATDITDNLLSISRMIDETVQESAETLQSLVTSSKTISNTGKELKDQGGYIQTGHRLLTKYNRREFTDKILIFIALTLFFGTVLYIIRRRLFL